MAQRRMLAKSISTSKKLNRVSDQAALLFSWTLPHLDDYGNMDGSVGQLKAIVVPSRKWPDSKLEKAMNELVGVNAWILYEFEGESYVHCEKFDDFQTFKGDRERLSLYPKYKQELRKPVDSRWKSVDSYKLSEVKVSESKLSQDNLISPPKEILPKTAGFVSKDKYLQRLQAKSSKISSSSQLLSAEISQWSNGRLKIGQLMKMAKTKGEQYLRECWAYAKDSKADDPVRLLVWKYGQTKLIKI